MAGGDIFHLPADRVPLILFRSSHPRCRDALPPHRPARNAGNANHQPCDLCHRSCGFLHPAGRESTVALRARAEHQNPAQRLRPLFAGQHQYQPAALSRRHAPIPMRRPAPTSFQSSVSQHRKSFV